MVVETAVLGLLLERAHAPGAAEQTKQEKSAYVEWSLRTASAADCSGSEVEDEVLHINLGTIGHIDHGKTTVTAALTQVAARLYGG